MAKYTCRVQANDHYAIVEKVDRPEPLEELLLTDVLGKLCN